MWLRRSAFCFQIGAPAARLVAAVVLAGLYSAQGAVAQTLPAPDRPSFANSTNRTMVVDVVVTDDNGNPVNGLRQQDFRLFENGDEQQIISCEAHEETSAPVVTTPKLPPNTLSNENSWVSEGINVVLLDQLDTDIADQELARRALANYFQQKPSSSSFAIFVRRHGDICGSCGGLRLVQRITADKVQLIAAVTGHQTEPQHPRLPPPQTQLDDTNMSALGEIGEFLKDLPGRKNLIWLSGNFDAAPIAERGETWFLPKFKGWQNIDPSSPLQVRQLTSARLALARAAVYYIDLTGHEKHVEADRICHDWRSPDDGSTSYYYEFPCTIQGHSINWVARYLGGRASHDPSQLERAIAQAVEEGTHYFTLTYSPTRSKYDGRMRSIKIKVEDKDLYAAYRHTYWAYDPATINRSGTMADPDVHLPGWVWRRWAGGLTPSVTVRLQHPDAQPEANDRALLQAMRFGTPERRGIEFSAHVEPTAKPARATEEQMSQLQHYEGFRSERVGLALLDLESKKQRMDKSSITLDSLPTPDTIFVQPYSIDYSIAASQFGFKDADNGKSEVNLQIGILAFDMDGQTLAGQSETVTLVIPPTKGESFRNSEYKRHQTMLVPERAAVLRLAVHDLVSNRIGSLEVPLSSISSPYWQERKRLQLTRETEEKGRTTR